MDRIKKEKIRGMTMATIGFLMLLLNALAYIFGWELKSSALTIMGLVFVVIGLGIARRNKFNIPK